MTDIREARAEDAAGLVALLASLGYPGAEAFIGPRVHQLLSHPDSVLLVHDTGSGIRGFISLHFIPQLALAGDFCRISYLCVADGSQGQGIGTTLEAAAVARARARGCDRIEVHCHARRTAAHRFYEGHGYEDSPRYFVKACQSA
ncbi:MAG: GNAT family N-acetyltransferase [Rhodocyclaceae bacterium]|nr:GNAT family N-acetyltransferase [Rhodocyclaceae bacterium]